MRCRSGTQNASFFYRPVELLGISLGAASCNAVHPEDLHWLRKVVKDGKARLVDSDAWTLSLGACASHVLSDAWDAVKLSPLDGMAVEELGLLLWICDGSANVAALLRIPEEARELEKALLLRCATSSVHVKDVSRAAVVYLSLERAVRRTIESELERRWQVGNKDSRDALQVVTTLCARFHMFSRQLLSRRESKSTVEIIDEYDVQDLMHALLMLHFDDVRPEEWTPSYAGSSSRMDFLLKSEKFVVETKMTRPNLGQKKVAEELTIDKDRYKTHPDCKILVALVYDPAGRCSNPTALESDLSEEWEGLRTVVVVTPRGT